MLEFDALPRRHMGIGRHRRTQGAMGRDIRPAVAAGPVPADPFRRTQVATGRTPQFFVVAGLVPAIIETAIGTSHTRCDATESFVTSGFMPEGPKPRIDPPAANLRFPPLARCGVSNGGLL